MSGFLKLPDFEYVSKLTNICRSIPHFKYIIYQSAQQYITFLGESLCTLHFHQFLRYILFACNKGDITKTYLITQGFLDYFWSHFTNDTSQICRHSTSCVLNQLHND